MKINIYKFSNECNNCSKNKRNHLKFISEKKSLFSLVVLAIGLIFFVNQKADAAIKIYTGTGNWSVATNWTGSTLPVAGDDIVIDGACTIAASPNLTFATLTVNVTRSLTINGSQILLLSGDVNNSGSITNNGTINTSSTSATPLPSSATWAGTIIFSSASNQTIPAGTYNILTVQTGGVKSLGGDVTVNGTLTMTSPASISIGANTLTCNAAITCHATGLTGGTTSKLTLAGATGCTLPALTTDLVLNTLTITKTATVTLGDNITMDGTSPEISIGNTTATILNASTYILTFNTSGGSLTVGIGTIQTANPNGFSGSSNTTINSANSPAINLNVGSWVEYNSGIAQNVTGGNYNNLKLTFGSATATGNITLAANGRLWIYGATFDLGTHTANCLTGGSATFNIQGNLIVGGTNNFPANYATYTFDGNRTITYNRNGDQTLFTKAGFAYDCWLVLSGNGIKQVTGQPLAYTSGLGYSTTINAGVTLDLNGINNNTISTLLGSGTIDNLNSSATDTYTLNINTPGAHGTFSGFIKNTYGKVAINKQGIYTQTLSGLNTYSGGTTIKNGIIALGISSSSADSGPLGAASGGITVLSGASLFMNGFSLTGAAGQALSLNGSGYGGAGGYGALSNYSGSGAPTYSGLITLTGNTQIFGDLNITNPGTITGSGFSLTLRSTTSLGSNISSVIGTGAGSVTLSTDAGQIWTFSGANTYTGKTIISAGTLIINTIADVNGGSSSLGAPTTAENGTIDIAGTGILKYTGTGHSSDRIINLTASGGTIDASGNGTLTLSGGITGNARGLVLTGTGSGIQSGVINTTTGTLTKNGQGTWLLSGLNTYSGVTTVNNGLLIAGIAHSGGANGAFGNTSPINLNGGNLSTGETTGFTQKTGTLTVSNNSTLTLGRGEHSITFASAGSFASARILTIADWQGTPGESGTAGQVIFTANPSAVLGQIRFLIGSAYYKATTLGTGPYEVVPTGTPEGNVSVEAFKKADAFSLQVNPNPFTHSASIRMEGKTGASFIWECMDLNGRIIETGRIQLNDGTTQANVCHTCAPGSYLLKIRDINHSKQQTLRLIKTE